MRLFTLLCLQLSESTARKWECEREENDLQLQVDGDFDKKEPSDVEMKMIELFIND